MRHFLILLSSLYAVSCQTPPAAMPRRTNERVAQVRRAPSVAHRAKANATGDEQPDCAWQNFVTGGNNGHINGGFPDSHAVYQVLVMIEISDARIYRIRGTFPSKGSRYFSLQSINYRIGIPIATIRDFEIQADPGTGQNPYTEEVADDQVGTYTIHVTPRGDQGHLNEIAVCAEGMADEDCTQLAAVIMRFYTSDPDQGMLNSETDVPGGHDPRLFGYAGMPTVDIQSPLTKAWRQFKPCDQSLSNPWTDPIVENFAKVIPGFDAPQYSDANDNFIMYLGRNTTSNGVYHSLDADYLFANGRKEATVHTGTHGTDYEVVAKVTGILPITAYNMHADPKVGVHRDYEIRYNSFSTIAREQSGPTIESVDDSEIRRFYRQTPGWAEHRSYSIVVGPSRTATCGLYNASTDLFLTTTLADGRVSGNFSVIDRQLVPTFLHDGLPDRSMTYARYNCTGHTEKSACFNPAHLRSIMKEYYPSITWYTCGSDGTLLPMYGETLTEKYFAENEPEKDG